MPGKGKPENARVTPGPDYTLTAPECFTTQKKEHQAAFTAIRNVIQYERQVNRRLFSRLSGAAAVKI
ncbi:hypothetical protein NS303_19270 [Pantoea ananatis]|jgi:hypothetical protein|nr:hypothetical protein KR94_17630 [Pantoea ananatis]KTR46547.1 hypothetical protein NS303_19270 [Pantoea ananatis]KTR54343.1 hypothetical protein NS311_16810 [Pantoea ananatis]KTR62766.1 hypothetical protein RSA47_20520 [Pantoea ananatis]KTR67707.1 hypothetical protein NS296_21240 [Pantoea ananatis]